MKTKLLLCLTLLSVPLAMGATAKVTGATAYKQGSDYTFIVRVIRGDEDKAKGKMIIKDYKWTFTGDAFAEVKAEPDNDVAYVKTVKGVDPAAERKDWPKGALQCVVTIVWSRGKQEELLVTNKLEGTVYPENK